MSMLGSIRSRPCARLPPLDSVQSLGIVTGGNILEATLTLARLMSVVFAVFLGLAAIPAVGQQGQWAAADNSTAKFMVDAERQWAEAACTHNKIAEQILADDFQGTSPDAKRYTKSEELADTSDPSKATHDCRLIDAKVRLFADNLALVYGSESSIRKAEDGTEKSRCLIWTDTWLRRNGRWQIIAAQDTRFDCKQNSQQ